MMATATQLQGVCTPLLWKNRKVPAGTACLPYYHTTKLPILVFSEEMCNEVKKKMDEVAKKMLELPAGATRLPTTHGPFLTSLNANLKMAVNKVDSCVNVTVAQDSVKEELDSSVQKKNIVPQLAKGKEVSQLAKEKEVPQLAKEMEVPQLAKEMEVPQLAKEMEVPEWAKEATVPAKENIENKPVVKYDRDTLLEIAKSNLSHKVVEVEVPELLEENPMIDEQTGIKRPDLSKIDRSYSRNRPPAAIDYRNRPPATIDYRNRPPAAIDYHNRTPAAIDYRNGTPAAIEYRNRTPAAIDSSAKYTPFTRPLYTKQNTL